MKMLRRWHYEDHRYHEWPIPDGWNVAVYKEDMDEVVNCAECGKPIKYDEGYTSLEIHTHLGFGYCVCEQCHEHEIELSIKAHQK